jgi:hypothetical protein
MDLLAGSAEGISAVSVVSCLLAASLCSVGLGHHLLLFSSINFGVWLRVLLTSVGQSRDGGQ